MGLSGKLSVELEIKSSPDKYFQGWIDHKTLFSNALGDDHKSDIHEGDGKSLNSINSYCYVLDGVNDVTTCKAKVEAMDVRNKSITFNLFDGHVGELYSKYKLNAHIFTKDGKNFVKCTIEYEKLSEEVPEPINYLDLKTRFCKGLDAHLLQA
ncbi:MLP-like protein 423 [Telopea speciosissima]|uniref:MLP-like protein 423 n=1 Tax=Telopea speciosissima TaxID=54955 RepID=UPI001CC75AEF|nr:MLP-like protein 423 [Telopea speciosissima]